MVKEVSSVADFDSELSTAGSKLVVVDFHALCTFYAGARSAHDGTLTNRLNTKGAGHVKLYRPLSRACPPK